MTNLRASRSLQRPQTKSFIVHETGHPLSRVPEAKTFQYFERDHENQVVDDLFDNQEIGQHTKIPARSTRVFITSKETCRKLKHESVLIISYKYAFRDYDVISSELLLDVFGCRMQAGE